MNEAILDRFTLEEVYLIRSCNLIRPDKVRIGQILESYLELQGMKELVNGVLKKLEAASEDDLKELWQISLD